MPLPTRQTDMTGLRTYIVEDSKLIRDSLVATLEELGPVKVVGTAEDEATAVRWASDQTHGVDLIIVDLFLKQGSGLGVLRAIHAMIQRCTMVVLSNYATPDIRRKCLDAGADQVFDKSHEIDALIQYCARLAASRTGPGECGPPR
jgi:DNA-binding NarL/FixJ family response regulator